MARKKINFLQAVLATLLFVGVTYFLFYHHKQITRYYYKAYRLCKRIVHKPSPYSFEAVAFPGGFNIHGIDVSHYQEDIDWGDLRTTSIDGDTVIFTFAFMKATQGLWTEDAAFASNWEDAHEHHIICGAYHYFLPDRDAAKQAANFISSVNLKAGDLPPVIDIEETRGRPKQAIVAGVKTMAHILELRYGTRPIIYSNISFIEDYLSDDFPDYYFWVAHYYQADLTISQEIHWLFWQHNDHAALFGHERVDVNVFNGDMIEFQNILVQGDPIIRPRP